MEDSAVQLLTFALSAEHEIPPECLKIKRNPKRECLALDVRFRQCGPRVQRSESRDDLFQLSSQQQLPWPRGGDVRRTTKALHLGSVSIKKRTTPALAPAPVVRN